MSKPGVTPVMQQWRNAKAKHPDAILLCRLGSFYEIFGDDAVLASRVLSLTLTKRNNGMAADIPMCGFPAHTLDQYVPALVSKGHRVAILEQVEEPGTSKGPVRRAITDVITPGVILEEGLLRDEVNNFILSVVPASPDYAAAALDVSTGDVFLTSHPDLATIIERFRPSELLVPGAMPLDSTLPVTRIGGDGINASRARREVLEAYAVHDITAIGLEEEDRHLVTALGSLLAHVRSIRPGGTVLLHPPKTDRGDQRMWLDRMTIQNLEIVSPLRSAEGTATLTSVLDHTSSAMGGRLLRRWLLEPLVRRDAIEERLDAVQQIREKNAARLELREALGRIRDIERIAGRLASGRASITDLFNLRDSLGEIPGIAALAASLPAAEKVSGPVRDLGDLRTDLLATLVRTDQPLVAGASVIRPGYSADLDREQALRDNAREFISALQGSEREKTGISSLKVGFNDVHGYYLEVSKNQSGAVPAYYQRRQTLLNAERFITPELKELEERILGAAERISTLEAEILRNLRERVSAYADQVIGLARQLATLDVLATLAHVALRNDYVRPDMSSDWEVRIRQGRHPVVEQMMERDRFIPNDVSFTPEERVIILTGANMAGKSTVLRQIGLIQVMAQAGSFVPATEALLPVCDRVFTRVGASDDLASGRSTFMVEMSELAAILANGTERSLLILDELGRGTSSMDGISLSWATVEHLAGEMRAKTIFATHYHEIAEMAMHLPGAVNSSMEVVERDGSLTFLRTMKRGATSRSFGIECARLAGVPEPLLRRARAILKDIGRDAPANPDVIRQADLFPPTEVPVPDTGRDLIERIRALDPNHMTPIQALRLLTEIQESLPPGNT